MSILSIIFGKSSTQELLRKCQKDRNYLEIQINEARGVLVQKERQIAQLNGDIGQYKQDAEILRAEAAASRYRIGQLGREIENLKEEIQKCQT